MFILNIVSELSESLGIQAFFLTRFSTISGHDPHSLSPNWHLYLDSRIFLKKKEIGYKGHTLTLL